MSRGRGQGRSPGDGRSSAHPCRQCARPVQRNKLNRRNNFHKITNLEKNTTTDHSPIFGAPEDVKLHMLRQSRADDVTSGVRDSGVADFRSITGTGSCSNGASSLTPCAVVP